MPSYPHHHSHDQPSTRHAPSSRTTMNPYTRWARLVLRTTSCPTDPRTLALFSNHAGISESTLRARCAASEVGTVATRDFTRLLRLIVRSQHGNLHWDPLFHLEARDPRTIRRLLLRGGLADWPHGTPPPPIHYFLDNQRLVHAPALAAVRQLLDEESTTHPEQ